MKDFALAGVIFILALCLFDAAQLASKYAAALAACANGVGFTVGRVVVACTPIDVPERKEVKATKNI